MELFMSLVLTTPPASEPVSLAEAKLYLRVDDAADDDLISKLIVAARKHAEASCGIAMIAQGWSVYFDGWPGRSVALPLRPLIAVEDVWVYGEDDIAAAVDPAHYFVDAAAHPPRLVLRDNRIWPRPGRPANGVEIALTAGYGADAEDVPQGLRSAILRLVAHWYENRGDERIPLGFELLLQPYREMRL
jgi:uncharacterized phiE125 gp8 family phage protein